MSAPLARADQALFPQQREGPLGRALCDLVLLLEILHGRQAAGQFATRDLPSEDRSELDVQRGHGVMVKAHMIMLGNCCAHLHF